jgi:hypothetical protein
MCPIDEVHLTFGISRSGAHHRTRRCRLHAVSGRLLATTLGKVNSICFAPLPESLLCRLRFKCVPLLKVPLRRQQVFESRVRSAVLKDRPSSGRPARQMLIDEPESQVASQAEVILVRHSDVAIGCVQIVR